MNKFISFLTLSFILLANFTFAQEFSSLSSSQFGQSFYLSPQQTQFYSDKIKQIINNRHNTQDIKINGIKNFHKVSEVLYRGAQPNENGYKELAKLGIKTVVDLRVIPQDKELIKSLGMQPIQIPINPLDMKDKYAKEFLSIMANPANYPVFVHCRYGSDRTGTMVALYRIYFQHWTKENALKEMTSDKYGFNEIFANLKQYIHSVNLPYKYTPQDRELSFIQR